MDKAPDFGSGDCRFESCHARWNYFSTIKLQYVSYVSDKLGASIIITSGYAPRGREGGMEVNLHLPCLFLKETVQILLGL